MPCLTLDCSYTAAHISLIGSPAIGQADVTGGGAAKLTAFFFAGGVELTLVLALAGYKEQKSQTYGDAMDSVAMLSF